jgi:hypothetical protein
MNRAGLRWQPIRFSTDISIGTRREPRRNPAAGFNKLSEAALLLGTVQQLADAEKPALRRAFQSEKSARAGSAIWVFLATDHDFKQSG